MKWMTAAALLALVTLAGGCGPTLSEADVVKLTIEETTGMDSLRMTVAADGEDIYGPLATLKPGETKEFVLNAPGGPDQVPGQHTVLYTFDRVGVVGDVGHARIRLWADDTVVQEDNSRKVLTGFAPTYSFNYFLKNADED